MKIEHVAVWTSDLDRLVAFYVRYFAAVSGPRYASAARPFESCFLRFDGGARLELMRIPDLAPRPAGDALGPAHLAFSTGSREKVDALTEELRRDGHPIASEPRRTGDGYYESVAIDPDGNRIEITI